MARSKMQLGQIINQAVKETVFCSKRGELHNSSHCIVLIFHKDSMLFAVHFYKHSIFSFYSISCLINVTKLGFKFNNVFKEFFDFFIA